MKPGQAIRGRPAALGLGDRLLRSGSQPDLLGHRQSRVPTGTATIAPATTSTAIRVVALDADTGKLKWHYQFSPHDEFDYDSVQVPVLADMQWQGRPRKVMMWANRNGFFYVLDRATGQFLLGKPFVEGELGNGFDEKGRPMRVAGQGADEPKARSFSRATRAAPTGISRPTARAPDCSTSRRGSNYSFALREAGPSRVRRKGRRSRGGAPRDAGARSLRTA